MSTEHDDRKLDVRIARSLDNLRWSWADGIQSRIPHYSRDLDAMREAEACLDDELWLEYMLQLCEECGVDPHAAGKWTVARCLMEATPRQRAKAYPLL